MSHYTPCSIISDSKDIQLIFTGRSLINSINGQRYTPSPERTTKTYSPTKGLSVLNDTQIKEMVSWHRDSRKPPATSFV